MTTETKIDLGNNVPALCQHPDCDTIVHRGIVHICGMDPARTSGVGCGLTFCGPHLIGPNQTCDRCAEHTEPYQPKETGPDFSELRLNAPEWATWRAEHPDEVEHARARQMARMTGRPAPKRAPPPPPDTPATPPADPGPTNPPAPPTTPPAGPESPPAPPSTPAAPGKPTTDTTPRSTKP